MNALSDWRGLVAEHAERADRLVAAHEHRHSRGLAHPVEDFLFTYYAYRPNQLRRWHPGVGHSIPDDGAPHLGWPFYTLESGATTLDVAAFTERRSALIAFVPRLMRATLDRPARHGCFGMHEWAMVYREDPADVRHSAWPLRLSPARIAATVEERGLRCTHFDAFRFFTPAAAPRNETALTREGQLASEQPGCLHAGMDLYKWAYKLSPATPSALVLDAFELARDIRYADMQASPYDLAGLGIEPIAVETAGGRAEYVRLQRSFTERARPIRERLLAVCDELTARAGVPAG